MGASVRKRKDTSSNNEVLPKTRLQKKIETFLHTDFSVKRSWVITSLALIFMLSPVGSFFLNLFFTYPRDFWPSPVAWKVYSHQLTWSSWVILGLNFVTGASLFIQRKLTWTLAIVVLGLDLVYSTYVGVTSERISSYLFLSSIFGATAMSTILFHFRYPYLDRRDSVKGVAKRYAVSIDLDMDGKKYEMLQISKTGALILATGRSPLPATGSQIQLSVKSGFNGQLECTVVRCQDRRFAVKFKRNFGFQPSLVANIIDHAQRNVP